MKIENIKYMEPLVLFIRHAERFPIYHLRENTKALLTEKGKKDAFRFGESLSAQFKKIHIYHSPVRRCQQTASNITNGLNNKNNKAGFLKGTAESLGGAHIIRNMDFLNQYAEENSTSLLVRKWFNGELPEDIIMPLKEVAEFELNFIKQKLKEPVNLVINVTHDWNIMELLEYYFKLKHEDIGYPAFLDGIAAYQKSGKLHMHYKSFVYETLID